MISVQSIVERIEATLDAEGSDRYTFDQDYKTAINSSVEWLQSVFNKAFADKKLSEENLQDLVRTVVYQTSAFSRVKLDPVDLGFEIWTILKVNPQPSLFPADASITPQANEFDSLYRDDLSYIKSIYSAARLTTEQWENSHQNIFEPGNERLGGSFKRYAYLNYSNYSSSSYTTAPEIEIQPAIPNQFTGVQLLKYPTPVNLVSDNVEFPKTLLNLVVQKALNFIAFKQGDQTNLYSVTTRDIQTLVQLMA